MCHIKLTYVINVLTVYIQNAKILIKFFFSFYKIDINFNAQACKKDILFIGRNAHTLDYTHTPV